MSQPRRYISAFEVASQNLRNVLAYFYKDLKMPTDTIKLQVEGILTSFKVQETYELERERKGDS